MTRSTSQWQLISLIHHFNYDHDNHDQHTRSNGDNNNNNVNNVHCDIHRDNGKSPTGVFFLFLLNLLMSYFFIATNYHHTHHYVHVHVHHHDMTMCGTPSSTEPHHHYREGTQTVQQG
jgi:hypothetical protein